MYPRMLNLFHISSKAHIIKDPGFALVYMHENNITKCFLETAPPPTQTHRGNKPLFTIGKQP